ncbi:hypothetical protein Ddye_011209 [Dipteronia dyeriana]|uniref:DYW domain-containing protein n=1 Tax=Dipteronia dyeriana TaxID=168575 RepID=A0AAD9UBZ3_9ROSI|nr:hypothetical protein Ddye_011209 [Dipteronia dyeriana]
MYRRKPQVLVLVKQLQIRARRNPRIYLTQNVGQCRQVSNYQNNWNHQNTEAVGTYQNSSNHHYTGNVGTYQNSSSVYQPNPISGQYQFANSLGQYQQNFDIHPNSNDIQTSTVASETAEASESSQSSGSIEKLDNFVKEGKVKEAVEVLGLLEKQYVPVDLPRFLQLMQACGEAKALEDAKVVHEHIVRSLSPLNVSTYNKIIRMYWECGSGNDAFDVFNNMRQHNLTSWDTMITWLAKNGLGEDAVDLFSRFKQAGLKPDGQMFIGVFFACRVLGDTREGMLHFESMNKDYGIVPSMEHYVSIVDMLGSAGHLDEALEFIEKMPVEPSIDVWEKMMNLCRIHGDLELGDRCAKLVELLDPTHLSEQSKAGLLPVDSLDLPMEKEKNKPANEEILTVRNMTSQYRAGDTSHPETDRIYKQIRGLKAHMKEAGYIPDVRFVLHDIDQESREEALLSHSERLALSHGLLTSAPRTPIRIIKNLRVCGDCHNALKIISKIVGRIFIIRDAKRFHQFQDGRCNCNDYW